MLITLRPHGIFCSNFLYICMATLSNHWQLALIDEALLSISPTDRGQLVKMLITFERHGIFRSSFAYLFI